MAKNKYGTTWWGQKWLDSLTGIDNANRIPRGLTYARNDSVFNLKVDPDKAMISAFVVGKYCPYYKVELKFERVKAEKTRQFMDAAARDLSVVSGLANRKLAPRLFDIATELGIKLFPTSWHDVSMTCTCPDFAVPCKHIAAVIYVVSEFIDTNPVMYFNLLGIDIIEELESRDIFAAHEEALETPAQVLCFRDALLLPKDIVSRARENDYELILTPVSPNDAEVLYLDDNLLSYEDRDTVFDVSLRNRINDIRRRENARDALLATRDESREVLDHCVAIAQEKREEYEELEKNCGALPKTRGRQSARNKAILSLLEDTRNELEALTDKEKQARARFIKADADLKINEKEIEELQEQTEVEMKDYQSRINRLLRYGYDPDEAETSFSDIKVLNADGSDGKLNFSIIDSADADEAAIDDEDAVDAVIAQDETGIDVRRYQGSLHDLERMTYEAIPDMGDSILALYGQSPAGFTHGNLRELINRTLERAQKMAEGQLRDVSERTMFSINHDHHPFIKDKLFDGWCAATSQPADNFSRDPISSHGYFSRSPFFFMSRRGLLELNDVTCVVIKGRKGNTLSTMHVLPPDNSMVASAGELTAAVLKHASGKELAIEDSENSGLFNLFSGYVKNTEMLRSLPADVNILYSLWFIATSLVKNRAIAPRLIVNYDNDLQALWYPATCSEVIRSLVTQVGLALQGFEQFIYNRLDRQYYMDPLFLGEMVLVPFIQSYISWAFTQETRTNLSLPELRVILGAESVDSDSNDLETRSLRLRLESYLSTPNHSQNRFTPVLRFVDISDLSPFSDSVFTHLIEEVRMQSMKEREIQEDLLLEYARKNLDRSMVRPGMTDEEIMHLFYGDDDSDQEYYEDDDLGSDSLFGNCDGIGMEFGFMNLPDEVVNALHQSGCSHVLDDTGFVSLHNVVEIEAFKSIRQECLRTLSRLSVQAPELEGLYTNKFNVEILPLTRVYQTVCSARNVLALMGVRLVMPKHLMNMLMPKKALHMSLPDGKINESQGFMSMCELINFDWSIAVGDHSLSDKEFRILMANAGKVVRFKNSFIYADPEMLRKLDESYRQKARELQRQELLSALLTGTIDDTEVMYSAQLREALDHMLRDQEVALPEGIKATLRPYQLRGYEWLLRNARIGLGSILADDMGLGKTLQVISALFKLKEEGKITAERPALVIVPTSLITNWVREVAHFAPEMTVHVFYGQTDLVVGDTDIILTSYGTARSRISKLKKHEYSMVVIDEAQAIKSMTTALRKALRDLVADNFIAMSGTPVENRLLEYYSILDFVNRGAFGSVSYFNNRFAAPIERNHDHEAINDFKKLTAPFIMRRLKSDKNIISDLPEKITSDQYCALTPFQASLYQVCLNDAMDKLRRLEDDHITEQVEKDRMRSAIILGMIQGLKAICNSPAQYQPKGNHDPADSGKVQRLIELLDEIMDARGKVLIFTQSVIMGNMLRTIISEHFGREVNFFHGGLSRTARNEIVDKFQNDPSDRILLLSLRAAGTGLNLTEANYVIHFDLWWNPAVENQATDRAYRIGQKKNVQVYRFICANTFEERINDMISSKRDLADLSVVTGETWIGNMSNAEISSLFRLSE